MESTIQTLTESGGRTYWLVKRAMDVLISLAGLVVSAPLMIAIWFCVKITSPGPGIFRQQRVGQFSRPFTIYKFRTMKDGSETQGTAATHGDKRITFAGKLLRSTHLDELPQLWNVLKGEMSLVGPRPRSVRDCQEIAAYIPNFYDRTLVKPGVTGLAQVCRRHDPSKEGLRESFSLDMQYIKARSILTDLKILAKTVLVILERNGG